MADYFSDSMQGFFASDVIIWVSALPSKPKLFLLETCPRCDQFFFQQDCAEKTIGSGKINPDLSNSWECAKCLVNQVCQHLIVLLVFAENLVKFASALKLE